MKKILFFCFIVVGNLFGMEFVEQSLEPCGPAGEFKSTKQIFENITQFYLLSIDEVVLIAKSAITESENSIFNAVILWAFCNCPKANDFRQLLLTVRFNDLDESFIEHVVKKTHLLFQKSLSTSTNLLEQQEIVNMLKTFYHLAKASLYKVKNEIWSDAKKFGYLEILDSRATGLPALTLQLMFVHLDNWVLNQKYSAAPVQFFGYHFFNYLKIKQTKEGPIKPVFYLQCRSEILYKISTIYSEDELFNLSMELGEEIEKIEVSFSITIGKLFSRNKTTKAFHHHRRVLFKDFREVYQKFLPMKAADWQEALHKTIASTDIACIKTISQWVNSHLEWNILKTKIEELNLSPALRSEVLPLFDKESDERQSLNMTFIIRNGLESILNDALIEQHTDGQKTLGCWLRITFISSDDQTIPSL